MTSEILLPCDLFDAEKILISSLEQSLTDNYSHRLSVTLKFEGLRLLPIANRISTALTGFKIPNILIFPDAGATALAKRDYPDLSSIIYSFKDLNKKIDTSDILNKLLIAVSPQPYDIEEFEDLVGKHNGPVVMINGRLEEIAVGIGSVARDRRKRFLSSWRTIFWLEPLTKGAMMNKYPTGWHLFKEEDGLYSFLKTFEDRPDKETIFSVLY